MINNRLRLAGVLLLVVLGVSACYKDAGDNVQPTSNRVDIDDIQPTTAAPPTDIPSPIPPLPTDTLPGPTSTRTLVPTTTPFDSAPVTTPIPPADNVSGGTEPTATSQIPPSFTPLAVIETPGSDSAPAITTPGMNDIPPTFTSIPTLNSALQPTPTTILEEEDECVHIVQSGDTLYSIAQDNTVLLADLVAANPNLLGGNANTPLQIGWELQIPGCESEPETGTDVVTDTGTEPDATPGEPAATQVVPPGTEVEHTVQPGEHLYAIARQYGVDPQAIIDRNNLTNPDRLAPGDVLIIPAP
ncbi:MAG: LysM peptidoglycan-binding domain-containing protein [Anaerolineae bacterium]|nr:LysM peptidoglycan-binding domain-containing protein [Anaerolineae bacterium]